MPRPNSFQICETPFFYRIEGSLNQALEVELPSPTGVGARAVVEAAGQRVETELEPAQTRMRIYAPALYPDPPATATVSIEAGSKTWRGNAPIGHYRPWTIYIAQDKHLDYGWIHPVEGVVERINDLTDYYVDLAESQGAHWNFDSSVWLEEYMQARPQRRVEQLLRLLRSGQFEVGAMYLVLFTGMLTTEELVRSLYFGRHLEREYGIPITTVLPQEIPSITWGMASILAGAGVPYVVKGAYDLRNSNVRQRDPIPMYYWEGPDGGRVLIKYDLYEGTKTWGGYAEAYPLWRGATYEERAAFITDTARRFEGYTDYPFDAILLAGSGLDEYPRTTEILDFIQRYNAQGWEYPKLVDATWHDFWVHVERQIEEGARLPVVRGDYGNSWEEWPAQLAYWNSVYRVAREAVCAGQTLSALAWQLEPSLCKAYKTELDAAYANLLKFCDHNIGGITPHMADDMRDRKATYARCALRDGKRVLEGTLAALADNIALPSGVAPASVLLVANPLSWVRTDRLEMVVPERGPYRVIDAATGQEVPCQVQTRGKWPEHYLTFLASDVPGLGYKIFRVEDESDSQIPSPQTPTPAGVQANGFALESPYYRMEVDPGTGGLKSLFDKLLGVELVDSDQPETLNQYVYTSDGERYSLAGATVKTGPVGPVSASLIVEGTAFRSILRTVYTLYADLPRLDICNELIKEPSDEPQSCHFFFPFAVPGRQYHYEGTAAILRPGLIEDGGDQLPGAGMAVYSQQHFVEVSNERLGVTLASPDAHLIQFGHDTIDKPAGGIDPDNSTVLSLVMENHTVNDGATRQGGQSRFTFRYSLTSHGGSFAPSAAVRFGYGASSPLAARWVTGRVDGGLPVGARSLLNVDAENVIVTAVKVAEEGDGLIVRLWECAGQLTEVTLDALALGVDSAWQTDLVERVKAPLAVTNGTVKVVVPARGFAAVKLV